MPGSPAHPPRIELSIPAQSEWVRVARLTVAGVAARQGFSIQAVEDLKVAVSEAINNAIQHGPHVGESGEVPMVSIAFEPRPQGLWIVVTDGGRLEHELSLDKSMAPAPQHEADLPEAGMGLLLIRSLMDRVELEGGNDADTSLKMWKALPRKESVRS
ncbi:anti-sigma B factor RsbW [bacterium]|nr:MAG: anti-sigma B factor RsbW [bacterium]